MKIEIYICEDVSETERARIQYLIKNLNMHAITKREGVVWANVASIDNADLLYRTSAILKGETAELRLIEHKLGDRTVYGVGNSESKELDFLGTLFFHWSRYEELTIKQTDYLTDKLAFEKQLLLVKEGLEKIPVVEELIRAYIETLTNKKIEIPKYQVLSHDVDFIEKFPSKLSIFRKVAGHFRHRKSAVGFPKLWKTYWESLQGKDAFDTFSWMLSSQPIEKTIYFLRGGKHAEDNFYATDHTIYKKAIELAKERGYRIGIHPSYESWNDVELVRKQKERLEDEVGEEIVSSRQHFLNFHIQETPAILESLNIREDSSLGYTRHIGYRCGTAFPFWLYDFNNEKAFDVLEKPLVFMDVAWLFEALRTDNHELPDLSQYRGGFNFHNSTFDEFSMRDIDMESHYLRYFG